MKYRIQRNHHREFDCYEQNKRAPRTYFIPYSNKEALRAVPDARQRYESDLVQVLSGTWDFCYYADGADIPKELDTDECGFDGITVPSTWQHTGYEPPVYLNTRYEFEDFPPELPEKISAGVYRKRFTLEQTEGKTILVSFLGVISCLDLYCNGYRVGYSEGAHNTAEFDLSGVIREGENELLAVVHKWSTATFIECQDMFRENGIFRDVLLYTLPKAYLNDFWLRPLKNEDGTYRLQATAEVQGEPNGWSLHFEIEGLENAVYNTGAKERLSFMLDPLQVTEWNAEQPVLYQAFITLSKAHETPQVVKVPIGFKHVEIIGDKFTFNGQLIKFKGVNHHDTDPVTGYCMTFEDYQRDLELMKSYNVNAIRTSHYPPDPHLLLLADKMGFYVVDEADIEAHGAGDTHKNSDLISSDKLWIPRYLDRVKRMLFRDRNHACVTMWSLGNEAGGHHCQDACYAFLHAVQPEIPVHYEGVRHQPTDPNDACVHAYDVHSEMYTDILRCGVIGRKEAEEWYNDKPFFLCEYAHAMGFGPGNLEEYVQLFYQYDGIMGGCVWEWADHAVFHPEEDAPLRWTYGGDHGERLHDRNFCVDGLVYPDRKPHTGALQMKNVYRPLRAAKGEGTRFIFNNNNSFANEHCLLQWTLLRNGQGMITGSCELDVPAMGAQEITLNLPAMDAGAEYHITFAYGGKAFEQLPLQELFVPEELKPVPNSEFSDVVDSAKLNFVRAWLDNDNWRNWTFGPYKPDELIEKPDGYYADDEKQFSMTLAQEALDGGAVKFTAKLIPAEDMLDDLQIPRFGLIFKLPAAWQQVKYLGLGEGENLPDCKAQSKLGIYETTVAGMNEPYIKPQENGTRCEVRWLQLTDEAGRGVRITNAPGQLSFSAHEYSPETLLAAKHQEDLRDEGFVFLNVDGFMRGSGSTSCGPDTLDEYKIKAAEGLEFSFEMAPVG